MNVYVICKRMSVRNRIRGLSSNDGSVIIIFARKPRLIFLALTQHPSPAPVAATSLKHGSGRKPRTAVLQYTAAIGRSYKSSDLRSVWAGTIEGKNCVRYVYVGQTARRPSALRPVLRANKSRSMKGSVDPTTFHAAALSTTGASNYC